MEKSHSPTSYAEDAESTKKKRKLDESGSGPSSSSASSASAARPFGPAGVSVRSPRFSPDGRRLVFLSNPASGPHFQCARLLSLGFEGGRFVGDSLKTVIDVARDGKGLYALAFPRYCWDSEGRLWMNTIDGCDSISLRIDIDSGAIVREDHRTVMGVFGKMVLFSHSDTGHPGSVVIDEMILTPAYRLVIEGCPGTAIVRQLFRGFFRTSSNLNTGWSRLAD